MLEEGPCSRDSDSFLEGHIGHRDRHRARTLSEDGRRGGHAASISPRAHVAVTAWPSQCGHHSPQKEAANPDLGQISSLRALLAIKWTFV